MKRIISFVILISLFLSLTSVSAELKYNYGFEVLSFALYKDGKKITSLEDNGIYPVGSVSKTFTAALIFCLSEDGIIDIEAPLISYMPDFKMADERYKDITVKMLLNHTAGLFGSTLKNSMLYKEKSTWNHDNFLSLLENQRLKSEPGRIESYSNDGYTLLEILSERVTGKSYTELFHEKLDAFTCDKSIKTVLELEIPGEDMVNSIGSGGLYGNAEALCEFASNLISEKNILSQMTEERTDKNPLETFGAGWDNLNAYPFDKYNIKALTKGGDTLNYHTSLIVLPEMGITASFILKGASSILAEAMAVDMIKEYLLEEGSIKIDFYDFEYNETEETYENPEKYKGFYISALGQYTFDVKDDTGILKNLYTGKKTSHKYLGNGNFEAENGIISFVSFDDEMFMTTKGVSSITEDKKYFYGCYLGVKKELKNQFSKEWEMRNGKVYFICDEVYNSGLYMTEIPSTNVYFAESVRDYLGYMKIESPNTALADIALPGIYGRDLTDLEIFHENGREFARAQGWTFVDSSSIGAIYNGSTSICTILPDGYARWFKSGDANGKKIEVRLDGTGMFALYDSKGTCTYSSLSGLGDNVIPQGGYIVFAGDAGTVFNINLQ